MPGHPLHRAQERPQSAHIRVPRPRREYEVHDQGTNSARHTHRHSNIRSITSLSRPRTIAKAPASATWLPRKTGGWQRGSPQHAALQVPTLPGSTNPSPCPHSTMSFLSHITPHDTHSTHCHQCIHRRTARPFYASRSPRARPTVRSLCSRTLPSSAPWLPTAPPLSTRPSPPPTKAGWAWSPSRAASWCGARAPGRCVLGSVCTRGTMHRASGQSSHCACVCSSPPPERSLTTKYLQIDTSRVLVVRAPVPQ